VDPAVPEPLASERYKVQFTATEEYVRLVEEAKALLSHAAPRATLEEVHLRAMRALVSELKKKKYGASAGRADREGANQESSRPRGRHVPASVRCAVSERDANRCAYVDVSGNG
jgi:hypothetical protein